MQAKGMSKEDATKIVEYALQEVSEMSPSDILKVNYPPPIEVGACRKTSSVD
jgi:hypothetical protein